MQQSKSLQDTIKDFGAGYHDTIAFKPEQTYMTFQAYVTKTSNEDKSPLFSFEIVPTNENHTRGHILQIYSSNITAIPGDKFNITIKPETRLLDEINNNPLLTMPFSECRLIDLQSINDEEEQIKRNGPFPISEGVDPQYQAKTIPGYYRNFPTLHHALVTGAANFGYDTIDQFAFDFLNGNLNGQYDPKISNDPNDYPDGLETLKAWHYGAYAGQTPFDPEWTFIDPPKVHDISEFNFSAATRLKLLEVKIPGITNPHQGDDQLIRFKINDDTYQRFSDLGLTNPSTNSRLQIISSSRMEEHFPRSSHNIPWLLTKGQAIRILNGPNDNPKVTTFLPKEATEFLALTKHQINRNKTSEKREHNVQTSNRQTP